MMKKLILILGLFLGLSSPAFAGQELFVINNTRHIITGIQSDDVYQNVTIYPGQRYDVDITMNGCGRHKLYAESDDGATWGPVFVDTCNRYGYYDWELLSR